MKFLKLGQSDLNMSAIGLGGFSFGSAGWMVGTETASKILKKALDLGIDYIDTANVYSRGESERIIGKITEGIREDIILSTKVGGPMDSMHYGFSRKEIKYQMKGSLERLKTHYVDIYFLHTWFDYLDVVEMTDILDSMVQTGETRYYGLSNVSGYQLAEIDTIANERNLERPQIVQNHYNAVYREDERDALPYCRLKSITYSPFSPLAAGFLTGKYKRNKEPYSVRAKEFPLMRERYFKENDFDILDIIEEISSEVGVKQYSVSLAYLLEKGFLPVVGISKPEHLEDVERALEINLKEEQMKRIEGKYLPHALAKGNPAY